MVPSEEFLRNAAQCEYTAGASRDPETKASWSRMAKRWFRCAELAQVNETAARSRASERLAQSVDH
jgi:hypothetical protein